MKGIVDPAITEPDVYAFQALAGGVASADQQKRVTDWLLAEACRLMQDPYTETKDAGGGSADDVMFALGRRHVGVLVREMLLPKTLEKARALSARMRPDQPNRTPTLSERRATARGKK